jgi:pyrimidine deaminase RibD-like protein
MSLDYAIKIAEANEDYPKWKLGCVIKKGGAVQSVGWSIWKYDPMFIDNHSNCSVHAEIHALRQMNYNARNCIMFVARVLRGGGIGMAKPCANCQQIILDSGIKRVTFTIDADTIGTWKPRS